MPPSHIALHGADYIDFENRSVQNYANLNASARTFVQEVEDRTGIPVSFIGTGPTNEEIIDRRISIGSSPQVHVMASAGV